MPTPPHLALAGLRAKVEPMTRSRRYAVHLFGKGTNEVDPASGDNEGLEALRAEEGEDLQHRLVD